MRKKLPLINNMTVYKYCKLNKINYMTVISRLKKGYNVQEAVKNERLSSRSKYSEVLRNLGFANLSHFCKKNDLCYNTVLSRFKNGITFENIKKPHRKCIYIFKNGKSLYGFCKRNKIRYATILYRIKSGLSIDEALNFKKKYNDVLGNYRSIYDFCKINNLPYSTIRKSVKRGFTLLKSKELYFLNKKEYLTIDGLKRKEYCTKYNMPFHDFYAIIKLLKKKDEKILEMFDFCKKNNENFLNFYRKTKGLNVKNNYKKRVPLLVEGMTCKEYCNKYNVSKYVFYNTAKVLKEDENE